MYALVLKLIINFYRYKYFEEKFLIYSFIDHAILKFNKHLLLIFSNIFCIRCEIYIKAMTLYKFEITPAILIVVWNN